MVIETRDFMFLREENGVFPLDKLNRGDAAVIAEIKAAPGNGRLAEMGFVPGESIQNGFTSPAGDPTAYLLGGCSLVALRNSEAKNIMVRITAEQKERCNI